MCKNVIIKAGLKRVSKVKIHKKPERG